MEQRRLRLGDTLDDYCPRERRLTNHAVVAMIEDTIKQTRCTTCDAEHVYKGGKVPKRKKKETPAALFKDVLAGMPAMDAPVLTAPVASAATVQTVAEIAPVPVEPDDERVESVLEAESPAAAAIVERVPTEAKPTSADMKPAPAHLKSGKPAVSLVEKLEDVQAEEVPKPIEEVEAVEPAEEGPVHRQLIRATLPRPEGQKDERRIPEFTIRQAAGRGGNGHFRGADSRMNNPRGSNAGGQGGNGNRPHGGGPRFAGSRPVQPGRGPAGRGGPVAGFRGGGQPRPGGGRKRSR